MVLCLALCTGVALSACAPPRGDTVPTPIPTVSETTSPSVEPSAAPEPDPILLPLGTALANLAYFDFVNKRLLGVNSNPSDAAIIENLVDAGFSKDSLEVMPDKTSELRRPTDSIEFSVLTSKDCLIGQFASGAYFSIIGPVLSGGKCLIGQTVSIP